MSAGLAQVTVGVALVTAWTTLPVLAAKLALARKQAAVVVTACVIVRLPVPLAVAKFSSAGKVAVTVCEPAPMPKLAGFTFMSLDLPAPFVTSVPTGVPSML